MTQRIPDNMSEQLRAGQTRMSPSYLVSVLLSLVSCLLFPGAPGRSWRHLAASGALGRSWWLLGAAGGSWRVLVAVLCVCVCVCVVVVVVEF